MGCALSKKSRAQRKAEKFESAKTNDGSSCFNSQGFGQDRQIIVEDPPGLAAVTVGGGWKQQQKIHGNNISAVGTSTRLTRSSRGSRASSLTPSERSTGMEALGGRFLFGTLKSTCSTKTIAEIERACSSREREKNGRLSWETDMYCC